MIYFYHISLCPVDNFPICFQSFNGVVHQHALPHSWMALSHSFHVSSLSLVNMTNTRAVHLGFDNDIYLWNHAEVFLNKSQACRRTSNNTNNVFINREPIRINLPEMTANTLAYHICSLVPIGRFPAMLVPCCLPFVLHYMVIWAAYLICPDVDGPLELI